MEVNFKRMLAVTAVAPIIWGSTYYVTRNFLPPEYPLNGAVIRALPAGVILLAYTRTLPRGVWWWKTLVISTLTISGFFVLVYISGSKLPTSVASMVMALSPLVTIVMAQSLVGEAVTARKILGGLLGVVGVFVLVGGVDGTLSPLGLLAAGCGMISSALGFVLTRRWKPPVNATTFTAWQLTCGGLVLIPIAGAFEGIMPTPPPSAFLGFVYIVVFASVIAYICWFTGVAHLPASTVSIVGLLNPLTGVVLGVLVAGEAFTFLQLAGSALIVMGICWGVSLPRLSK